MRRARTGRPPLRDARPTASRPGSRRATLCSSAGARVDLGDSVTDAGAVQAFPVACASAMIFRFSQNALVSFVGEIVGHVRPSCTSAPATPRSWYRRHALVGIEGMTVGNRSGPPRPASCTRLADLQQATGVVATSSITMGVGNGFRCEADGPPVGDRIHPSFRSTAGRFHLPFQAVTLRTSLVSRSVAVPMPPGMNRLPSSSRMVLIRYPADTSA